EGSRRAAHACEPGDLGEGFELGEEHRGAEYRYGLSTASKQTICFMTSSARNVPTQTRHESRQHRPRDPEHRGPAVRQVTARPEGGRGARVLLSRVLRARPWELMLGGPSPGAPPPPALPGLRPFRPGSPSRLPGGPIRRRRFAAPSRRARPPWRPPPPPRTARPPAATRPQGPPPS